VVFVTAPRAGGAGRATATLLGVGTGRVRGRRPGWCGGRRAYGARRGGDKVKKKKCPRGVAFLRSVALCCVRGVGWLVGEMGQGAPVEGTCRAGSGGALVPAVPPPEPSGSAPRAGMFPSWWLRGGRLVWHTVECVRDLARARRRLTTRCRWPLR